MTTLGYVTHSLQEFVAKSNGRGNGNKGDVYTRAPIGNVLAIVHKCRDSLPFKAMNSYKRKGKHNQRYTQNFIQNYS